MIPCIYEEMYVNWELIYWFAKLLQNYDPILWNRWNADKFFIIGKCQALKNCWPSLEVWQFWPGQMSPDWYNDFS